MYYVVPPNSMYKFIISIENFNKNIILMSEELIMFHMLSLKERIIQVKNTKICDKLSNFSHYLLFYLLFKQKIRYGLNNTFSKNQT